MARSLLLGKYRGPFLPSSFNRLRSFSSKSFFFSKRTYERKTLLEVKDLTAVNAESKQEVLKGVNFLVREGEVHVINNNEPGNSIFFKVLFGDPQYQVTQGSIRYRGLGLVGLPADRRSITEGLLSFKPIPCSEPTKDIKPVKKQRNGEQAFCNELKAGILGNDLGVLDGVQPVLLDDAEMEGVLNGVNILLLAQCPSMTMTKRMDLLEFIHVDSCCTHTMVDRKIISPPCPEISVLKGRDWW